jgi:hypothetical protein
MNHSLNRIAGPTKAVPKKWWPAWRMLHFDQCRPTVHIRSADRDLRHLMTLVRSSEGEFLMKRCMLFTVLTIWWWPTTSIIAAESYAQVVVYGATSGGITAAIQADRMGKSVLLIEPGKHLGGLTSGGLGATDIGNKAAIGGLSREFYRRVGTYYSQPSAWKFEKRETYLEKRVSKNEAELWTFEPHVAEQVYRDWLAEFEITLLMEERLDLAADGVTKIDGRITAIRMESGRIVKGDVFIDATYEGDLMAKAGVPFHVGREANRVYGETLNGIQVARSTKHQFIKPVDPFVIPGDRQSGLLPLISADSPGNDGDGDHRVQAYCFRMCTTDIPENRAEWTQPAGYDERVYELLLRNFDAGDHRSPWHPLFMPNRKTDTNNNFAISTDYIGANYDYPDADYATRQRIFDEHLRYQQGLMYTLAHHPRVPEKVRDEFRKLGPAKDEFVETGHWPHQLYVREARRLISDYVMHQGHCQQQIIPEDPVGLGAYNMDSHNCQRYVSATGEARNEGDIQVPVNPYGISYRSLRPRKSDCTNLFVPVCLAASHIAYGSIRMEPVFMVLGQSVATAAALAIDQQCAVQDVSYTDLRGRLLADGQVLEWTGPQKKVPVAISPERLPGTVIDNTAAVVKGDWVSSASIDGFIGGDYLHDDNTGKGEKSVTYHSGPLQEGTYEIRLYATANANRATNIPVTIRHGQTEKRVMVNQRTMTKPYVVLSNTSVPPQGMVTVTLSTTDTDGYVIADAVSFVLALIDSPTAVPQ